MHVHRYRKAAAAVAAALLLPACGGTDDHARTAATMAAAEPGSLIGSCTDLAARLDTPADTTITGVTLAPSDSGQPGGQATAGLPEHCVVTGRMFERVGAIDGHEYAISFEMRLPLDWNGRFYHQGNGGMDGNVVPALGSVGAGPVPSALARGFAVLSSNAGHDGSRGPAFGIDPQARLDYGYQAVEKLTPVAHDIIEAAYGRAPDRNYFGGCSNGGRHAMIAAARYGDIYDGILAGAPGFRLPLSALANIAGAQLYSPLADAPQNLASAFTNDERTLLADAVLAQCDALDGLTDGIVHDTWTCQAQFDIEAHVPTCDGERDGTCLTVAQKDVLSQVFAGPTTTRGTRIYNSFPYDPGIAGNDVAFWEFMAPLMMDSGAVAMVFQVPPADPDGFNGPEFALSVDLDEALERLYTTDAVYTEAAMEFMTPPDAANLATLRERGGRMIVYHGASDRIFSVDDTRDWYEAVDAINDGRAADFVRFFPVPGMNHCSGGPATDSFDALGALIAWVEGGEAPDRMIASARGPGSGGQPNANVPDDWAPDRTRPLCPYPSVARYTGSGDPERAENFVCD
jgi:hypothetical protein